MYVFDGHRLTTPHSFHFQCCFMEENAIFFMVFTEKIHTNRETFFGHMKREMYYGRRFATRKELYEAIDMYIKFYNEKRYQIK